MPTDNPLSEVPPKEFIAARNALARELRQQGKPEEARRIAALQRPSPTLWVVNQLGKTARGSVQELIESTQRARRAQIKGRGGDELRDAMRSQREVLQQLLREAGKVAARIGVELTPQQQRRIQDSLETAAATQPNALREGTLEHELSAAGFSALLSGAEVVPARAGSSKLEVESRAQAKREAGNREQTKRDLGARESAKRDAEARAQERKRQLAEKREQILRARQIQRAQKEASLLTARAQQLEKRAAQAQSAADQARSNAAETRKTANDAAARLLQLQKV
jgi:hypothetical protein